MPDPLPSCFGGGAGAPPSSTSAGPSLTTSVYETHLGLVALCWSRTVLGLSLRLDLFFDEFDQQQPLHFRCRPWLLWKRRGSKSFSISNSSSLVLSWDLSSAKFPATGGPEPSSSFYFAVVLDGNMLLIAGDSTSQAFKRTKAKSLPGFFNPNLVSRREHVLFKNEAANKYETSVFVGGGGKEEKKVLVDVSDSSLRVLLDGERLLHVRRIRWKFRGSEVVDSGNGKHVRVSWDLHDWLFPLNSKEDLPPPLPPHQQSAGITGGGERGCAVFTLTFEDEEENKEGYFGKEFEVVSGKMNNSGEYFGKKFKNWSISSNGDEKSNSKKKKNSKSLIKTSSSSSSMSSISSASSSTVMDWASQEETRLKSVQGFSLVVYAWKT